MLRLLIALLCLVSLAEFSVAAAPASPVGPLKIGVSGPFTGGSSPMGISMREGIRIAAAEINAAGGVLGRQVELVERDDEARNERGAQVVQELIDREHVVAGLGIANTGVALASQRFYQQARIPIITSVATGSLITKQFLPPLHPDNFVFRVSASDTLQAAMIVAEAVDRRGIKRVAIFHDATNYGQLGREDLERTLAERNIVPVAVERFQIPQPDMSSQLRRARQAGAEAILTYGIGPELAQIVNGMARLNWHVPLIGSWTLAMSNFIDNAGPNGEGARMPQTFIPEPTTPRRKTFLDAWKNATGSTRIPVPPAAAQGYDSTLLLAAAIRQAGSTDGDRIREALENLQERVEGVIMTYSRPFSKDRHETINSVHDVFMGEVQNGRVVFAYDEDRRRASRQ
ncbi:MAG TPA: ABC transporter substrate-binding protein [Aromatoleum sp.]|uniref:ABC transporter substrate-binding protein n=1 Tax=Aromatoleum sp. TaxID=2307007 RepID=UPI002B4AAC59|nr:ABC transporter substrate-binding protein [Aromatoleum sp.]HJV26705.1 ABC transporter substrate-binding protein [Aromatoleum sp.]